LIEKKDGYGRIAAFEIFTCNAHSRELIERADLTPEILACAMRKGAAEGMQYFSDEIEKLIQKGVITRDAAREFACDVFEDSGQPNK
jgi:Tfp pilus assembly pilus retraction ATPase PilT